MQPGCCHGQQDDQAQERHCNIPPARVVAKMWKPRVVKSELERIVALEADNEQLKAPNQAKQNNNSNDNKGKYAWKKRFPQNLENPI
jgi:hypothetical protein